MGTRDLAVSCFWIDEYWRQEKREFFFSFINKFCLEKETKICTSFLIFFFCLQEKLAKIALNIYVMESMAYMTAGIIDSTEKADVSLEAAMVKVRTRNSLIILVHPL